MYGIPRNCCLLFTKTPEAWSIWVAVPAFPAWSWRSCWPNVRISVPSSMNLIAKKCRFLEEVAHRVGVAAEIRNARIEDATPEPFDLVTARACAPLTQLLSYAYVFQGKNTQCLFLKGRSVGAELVEANKSWTMVVEQHRSRSDPSGMILAIRELRHVTSRH